MKDWTLEKIAVVQALGDIIGKSGQFTCQNTGIASMLACTLVDEGLTISELCGQYQVVYGKICLRAEAILGRFNRLGGVHEWLDTAETPQKDGRVAVIKVTPPGGVSLTVSLSEAQAKERGFFKKNDLWLTQTASMLRARVGTMAVKMVLPGILAGTAEDIADEITSSPDAPKPSAESLLTAARPATEARIATTPTTPTAPPPRSAKVESKVETEDDVPWDNAKPSTAPPVKPELKLEASRAPAPARVDPTPKPLVKLPDDVAIKFMGLFPRDMELKVADFLKRKKGFKMESFDEIPMAFAQVAIAQPEAFLKAVNDFHAAQGGAK